MGAQAVLTVAEVAAELKVTDVTVRRLIRAGRLAAYRSSYTGALRVTREALDAYQRNQWEPVAPGAPQPAA
jgi:excisionase family DNA binding protein